MNDKLTNAERAHEIASEVTNKLVANSVRQPLFPERVQSAIETSLTQGTPLRLRMTLCPNWQVDPNGRSVGEIPVESDGRNLIVGDPAMKIVSLLSDEVPGLVGYLNRQSLNIQLLVVVADILSPNWVHDEKTVQERLEQNRRAVNLLLKSTGKGKEVFNDKSKAEARVQSQAQLATNTPRYHKRLEHKQWEALQHGSQMYEWYLDVIQRLQEMGEYEDKRQDLAGMQKIWERARFLAGIYALDGEVIQGDFQTAGFGPDLNHGYIALGTVATSHGDIIAKGWNFDPARPIGVVTPFSNAMEHSWSERKNPAKSY